MKNFLLDLNNIDDVKEFTKIISTYNCDILAKNKRIDAKSIMGLLSLDLSHPIDIEIMSDDSDILDSLSKNINKFIVH